jgi:hypothetical protein
MCLVRVCLEVTWFDMSYRLVRLSFDSYGMLRLKNSHTNTTSRHGIIYHFIVTRPLSGAAFTPKRRVVESS